MLNFGNKEFRNLQEQVLKNAQDIETLKGRENLQVVIVNELPEVGNPNYIYLLAKDGGEQPDVYEEYIWLEDEERYEKIGGVSIDLTHYVTLDTDQTITGTKKFQTSFYLTDNWCFRESSSGIFYLENAGQGTGLRFEKDKLFPYTTNYTSLGISSFRFKDLYLSGTIDLGNNATITKDNSNRVNINYNGDVKIKVGNTETYFVNHVEPDNNNTYDLGRSGLYWRHLYLVGNLIDGVNAVSVANIASKVTSTFISGTFDSNGESTIDTEQAGTPEGLFIFTYGNCQCFVRLTATMIQNADVTPIRVSCPMITSGSPYLGWLEIERSSNTLTISVKDGNIHVDSGFAWTLTKTNLL